MRQNMNKLKLFGLVFAVLVVGIIVGGYFGALWSSHAMARVQFTKPELDMAFLTSQESQWAAFLRLGETNNAISDLEKTIGIQLTAIASWESVTQPDAQARSKLDAFLIDAKTYQKSYPLGGADPARITALLAAVPDRDPHSYCRSGVCRLDDLRLAKVSAPTNSP
jgi:hypothetical protein